MSKPLPPKVVGAFAGASLGQRAGSAASVYSGFSAGEGGMRFNPNARLDTSQVDDRRPPPFARRYGGTVPHMRLDPWSYPKWRKTRPG